MAHRTLEQQKVRLAYDNAVRLAIREIADAGQYPSLQRTFSLIMKRNSSLISSHLTNLAIRRLRTGIGQDTEASVGHKPHLRSQTDVGLNGRQGLGEMPFYAFINSAAS
jgi:hypothetical protein